MISHREIIHFCEHDLFFLGELSENKMYDMYAHDIFLSINI